MTKKILYISRAVFPAEKSHSLSIMRVCQAFTDVGYSVVLSGLALSREISDPIEYYGLKGGFSVELNYLGKLLHSRFARKFMLDSLVMAFKNRKIIKDHKPDLIYSRLTLFDLLFIPKDTLVVYETHNLGYLDGSWLQCQIFKLLLRKKNFRKFIVTTERLQKELSKHLKGIKVVLARLSAEPPIEISESELCDFQRDTLSGKEFNRNVGYTGFLDKVGLRGTEIICQLADKIPKAAFHIVGGETEIVNYWKKVSEKWNHNKNLFFYGYRNPNEIPYFLKSFDIALAPLQNRTNKNAQLGMSPLKIPQYMGYGKAIVASDIAAHREILQNNNTALLVRSDNIDEWVDAINRLFYNQELKQKLETNARKAYYQGFTPEKRVKLITEDLFI